MAVSKCAKPAHQALYVIWKRQPRLSGSAEQTAPEKLVPWHQLCHVRGNWALFFARSWHQL